MLKRKIFNELITWKSQANRKSLLVKGARQVGKTTTIRQFAKENYKNFVEINFEQMPLVREAFNGNLDARTVILNLSSMGLGPFVKGETLVFFDEIQSCPQARTAIKFLVEEGSFDYIESGSLLGLNFSDVSSYPVGYEHQIEMYPLDFEEYLLASNISSEVISTLRQCYETNAIVPDFLHKRIMEKFREFLIVGGMPEAVSMFLYDFDFGKTKSIQQDILNSYRDDISKYAGKDKLLAKSVFDAIPQQLSKQDKRFVLADIEKGASQRKYGEPTEWLSDAGIAYFSFNTKTLELPFALQENRSLYKLYMFDTGLLCNMALDAVQADVLQGKIDINEGALTENFVATELFKHGKSLNYYDKKSRQELDFVFPENNRISIIEVKSGKNYKSHSSLTSAITQNLDKMARAMVLSRFNVEQVGAIQYYPLYMAMFI